MPICPQCSATIHAGADDQCPACGYSLRRADALFGDGQVEFTRVVDAAGALTHQQRQELLHFLENLERDIPPVALCIYITDDGQADEFRTHAHWILNHARIHHPSFGRREKHKAIEDAELRLRFAKDRDDKDAAADEQPAHEPAPASWLSRVHNYLRDALHPHLPPPVKQEWMLILVLDVQLERACFSWGYQLDPYVNPDSINRCIVGAKFQFRERAMVAGLRRVMKAAVREIAAGSRRVNAQLRRTGRSLSLLATLLAAPALLCPCEAATSSPSPAPAASAAAAATSSPAASAVLTDDDVAEEVLPSSPAATAATGAAADAAGASPDASAPPAAPPPPEPGAPATYNAPPRWNAEDHRHLMDGELTAAYSLLLPPADAPKADRRFRVPSPSRESDKKLPARYCEAYKQPSPSGLCDPQGLLTVEERRDVEHVLREVNANGRFRVYASLYRAGQQLPPELTVHHLTKATAQPLEYAALLLFPFGDAELLDLGYQDVNPSDDDRHAWLRRVRDVSVPAGGGVESLLLALREVHAILLPLSSQFTQNSPEVGKKLPRIDVQLRPDTSEKKVPVKDKIKAFFLDESNHSVLISAAAALLAVSVLLLIFFFRRRSGSLLESAADVRLSSPYGAGVSRYVRYLEGKESPKESRIF